MEGQKIDLLAKFIQTAAENSETIDIFQSRKYLHPHEKLLKTHLDEDLTIAGRGYREGLFLKQGCQLAGAMKKSEENEPQTEKFKRFSILHEALFWTLTEKSTRLSICQEAKNKRQEIEEHYKSLLSTVESYECEQLANLARYRVDLCKKLNNIDWKEALIHVYCEVMKDLISLTTENEKITFDKMKNLLQNLQIADDETNEEKIIASHNAKAYALIFESLEKPKDLSIDFVKELNRKLEGSASELKKQRKLEALVAWINEEKGKVDIVTLAAISHCAMIRLQYFKEGNHRTGHLLQNFLLMQGGFPPMHIFSLKEYKSPDLEARMETAGGPGSLRGVDYRPFLRFVFKHLEETMKQLMEFELSTDEIEPKKRKMEEKVGTSEKTENIRGRPSIFILSPPHGYTSALESALLKDDNADAETPSIQTAENYENNKEEVMATTTTMESERTTIGWHSLFIEALKDFNPELLKLPDPYV